MKLLTAVAVVLGWAMSSPALVVGEAKFRIEIQASGDECPKFSVTNLSAKALTAYTIEFSVLADGPSQSEMNWDPLVQRRGPKGSREGRLRLGKTITLFLPHKVGGLHWNPCPAEELRWRFKGGRCPETNAYNGTLSMPMRDSSGGPA